MDNRNFSALIQNFIDDMGGADAAEQKVRFSPCPQKYKKARKLMLKMIRKYRFAKVNYSR